MRVFVGLGSNMGEREEHIRQALDLMAALPDTDLVRASSLYDTEPVGEIEQPHFLNAVAELDTELEPRQLLWNLLLIEKRIGRVRTQKWGPRVIDLDLLLYGERVVAQPGCRVPHPRLAERAFVLVPLAELAADARVPGHGTVAQCLQRLPAPALACVRREAELVASAPPGQ